MSRYDLWDKDGNFRGNTKSKGKSKRLKELWDKDGNLRTGGKDE